MSSSSQGVDVATIALWLGHSQTSSHRPLPPRRHDPRKKRPSPSLPPPAAKPGRYRAPDTLLAFLESL